MTKQYDICLLPGDGIGPEIIAEGVKILNAVGAKYDTRFDCKESLIGGAAIDAVGDPLPAATLDAAKAAEGFQAGDHISHKTFGPGVVLSTSGDMIEVRFTRTGKVKKLMKGFAPIVKVEA